MKYVSTKNILLLAYLSIVIYFMYLELYSYTITLKWSYIYAYACVFYVASVK
jgi:hypothetical protein